MSNEPAKAAAAAGGGKKKRNRKKKSKNKDGSAAPTKKEEPQNDTQPSSMNPHAALRNSIKAQGYSFEEIDKAMEEMWDKGLAYDEVEAVLKYLKTGGKEEKKEEDKKEKPAAEKGEEAKSEENGEDAEAGDGDKEEKLEPEPVVPKQAPMTMVAKLDMVAGFENMSDAVFALTEWVNKAAKPKDIEELCSAQNTKALPKIFRRSITECEDNNRFETAVLPSMDRLMAALLGKCGVAATSFSETRMCFESLLKQARRVYMMQQPDADEYANRISEFIVSRISMALEEYKVITGPAAAAAATETGNGVKSAAASFTNVDDAIAQLLSTRESYKTAAKRFSAQARSACATLTAINGGTSATNGHASKESTSLDTADIFLAIGGSDVKQTFDQEKTRLEELKSKVNAIDSEKAKQLQSQLDEVQEERRMIADRIAELKVSIENLESHDADLCAKVVELESGVAAERANQSEEADKLNEQVKESQKAVKYGNSIGTLVDLLKNYDDALDMAVNGSVESSMDTSNAAEVAKTSIDMFSSRVAKYFAAEAQCVDFLRKRIAENTEQIPALKIEIAEMEGLGLTTTISQMELSIKEKESLLATDAALVERLTEEANGMFDALVSRLEQYEAAADAGSVSYAVLESIPANATKLGIRNPDRLVSFLKANGGFSPSSTDPPVSAPNGGKNKVAPIGTPKGATQQRIMTEQSATMPKFTWAAASKPTASQPKASLVDIQKEELESRNV